jgi:SAM-dependent methyltransferase
MMLNHQARLAVLLSLISLSNYAAQAVVDQSKPIAHTTHIQVCAAPDRLAVPTSTATPCCTTATSTHLQTIFTSPDLRKEFSGFLDNVMRQIPAKDFWALVDNIKPTGTDIQIYEQLQQHIGSITPYLMPLYKLKSDAYQQNLLGGQQARQLLADRAKAKKPLRGCVEIGSPGIYTSTIQGFLPIQGTITVVNEQESPVDRIRCGGIKPHSRFVPLTYEKIAESAVPSNSVDLVICFIGLHHCPKEKLNDFIASIYRILRPGGIFLLRDHDAKTLQALTMAHAAHSIYNVITANEPVKAEAAEYRNFQALQFWVNALESSGFKTGPERLLQAGDPTANTMLKFIKPVVETPKPIALSALEQEQLKKISDELKNNSEYKRDVVKTYLNGPEWLNVDASQEYGEFVKNNNWYEFPHLRYIATYWDLALAATWAAACKHGFINTLMSEYTRDSLFIGTTMTAEYIAKSLCYLPNKLLMLGTTRTPLQDLDAQTSKHYGAFLNHTPWYAYPYNKAKADYAQQAGLNRKDIALYANRWIEYTAKGIVAGPIKTMCEGTAPGTIQLLVKDVHNEVEALDSRIKVLETYAGTPFKRIEIPRYLEFVAIVKKLAATNIQIQEIAGNKAIQFKVRYKKNKHQVLNFDGCKREYSWALPTQPDYLYSSLNVDITQINSVITRLQHQGVDIQYIHDF